MRHRLASKKRKWPWILAATVLILGAFGVAGGKNNSQPNNLVAVPTTTTPLPITTSVVLAPTTTTSTYRFVEPNEIATITTTPSSRSTKNYGTPKPKPKPKPKSNSKGHICLPGERDGDNDGKCGE